jgi:predicted nucleic acid-binding protein
VTVLDSSAVVDYLLGAGASAQVQELIDQEDELAAPDLLVFEVLAVLRREACRQAISRDRAEGAIEDLGDLPLQLYPALPLRSRAWALREDLTAAAALFVALAEALDEPLATCDRLLAAAAAKHSSATVIELVTG